MRKTLWLSSDTWGVGKPLRPAQVLNKVEADLESLVEEEYN